VSHRFPLTSRLHRSRTAAEDRVPRKLWIPPRVPPQMSPSLRAPHPLLFRGSLLRQTKQTKQASQKQRVSAPPDPDALHRHLLVEQELVDRADALAGRVPRSPDPPVPRPSEPSSRRSPPRLPRDAADDPRASPKSSVCRRRTTTGRPVRRWPRQSSHDLPPSDAARGFAGTSAILGESPLSANNRSSNLHLHATACSR
jgi:hypothetical protein